MAHGAHGFVPILRASLATTSIRCAVRLPACRRSVHGEADPETGPPQVDI